MALRNTDHEVSVPKCPGKWLYFINQGQLFQINYINADNADFKTGDVAHLLIWSQIIFF